MKLIKSYFIDIRRFFILLLIFLPCNYILKAQENRIFIKALTRDDGLSSNRINCITEDGDGFMWFGTYDGLCRYSGNDFENYIHNPNDTTSISSNQIFHVIEEKETRNLWVASQKELNYFNTDTKKFTRPIKVKGNIINLCYDSNFNLWIITSEGLYKYDKKGFLSEFTNESNPHDGFDYTKLTVMHLDKKNKLWIGGINGLYLFDPEKNTISRISKKLDDLSVTTLYSNKKK